MAFSLNRIMLIGNLGRDAETRFTTNNLSVTTFTLATTHSFKGKDGNWQNETTWHNVVAYSLSDYYKDNLKKGKKFYVEGRLSKRDYIDKEGIKKFYVEVVSEKLIPLESSFAEGNAKEQIPAEVRETEIQMDDNEDLPF